MQTGFAYVGPRRAELAYDGVFLSNDTVSFTERSQKTETVDLMSRVKKPEDQ